MIRFFRNIRKQLAAENKVAKYSRYAIGEVLLIMIGIFMALQLQNWNERQRVNKEIDAIFIEVQDELALNLKALTRSMNFYEKKDSIIFKVLNNSFERQDFLNNKELAFLIHQYDFPELQNVAYNRLVSRLEYVPSEYNEVLNDINEFYQNRWLSHKDTKEAFIKWITSHLEQFSDAHEGYVDMAWRLTINEDVVDYMVSDFRFKNNIVDYYIYRDNLKLNQLKYSVIKAFKSVSGITDEKEGIDSHYFISEDLINKYSGAYRIQGRNEFVEGNIGEKCTVDVINGNLIIENNNGANILYPHKDEAFAYKDWSYQVKFIKERKGENINGFELIFKGSYSNWKKIE